MTGTKSGLLLVSASIEIVVHEAEGTAFGGCIFEVPSGDHVDLVREDALVVGPVLLAGSLAEDMLLGGHLDEGYAGDFRILRLGLGWTEGGQPSAEQVSTMHQMITSGRDLVTRHAPAIKHIARNLLTHGSLSGSQVQHVVNQRDPT